MRKLSYSFLSSTRWKSVLSIMLCCNGSVMFQCEPAIEGSIVCYISFQLHLQRQSPLSTLSIVFRLPMCPQMCNCRYRFSPSLPLSRSLSLSLSLLAMSNCSSFIYVPDAQTENKWNCSNAFAYNELHCQLCTHSQSIIFE